MTPSLDDPSPNFPNVAPLVPLDIERILAGKVLIQATSGGGKSWALRRMLEQLYGAAQQIVFDPEGEYHTLRELRVRKADRLGLPDAAGAQVRASCGGAVLMAVREIDVLLDGRVRPIKAHVFGGGWAASAAKCTLEIPSDHGWMIWRRSYSSSPPDLYTAVVGGLDRAVAMAVAEEMGARRGGKLDDLKAALRPYLGGFVT